MFITRIDELETYDGRSAVIVLGECRIPDDIGPGRLASYPDASPETFRAIGSIDVRAFNEGITLVISGELAENNYEMVRLIQKHLVFCYVKFVWFPKQDTFTPDPFGMGGDKGPLAGMVYDINKLENLPWLMSGVRTKEIEDKLPPTPVLLLAPGPSLEAVGPHLKALSERFLVLSLARSLSFCQEHGVVPDVVIQLDTHGEQELFYPPDMDLSNTWLIGLSCAPMGKYLHRFAGVFWIDTFDVDAYGGDHYEMRNSWLSSLIAMMGVANLFRPPKVLMAGTDLSFRSTRYYDHADTVEGRDGTLTNAQELAAVHDNHECVVGGYDFPVRLNDGTPGMTRLAFLATAFEAESIINEVSSETQYYNLSRQSILNEAYIPCSDPASHVKDPLLNRAPLFRILGLVSEAGRHPEERVMQRALRERLQRDEKLLHDANIIMGGDPATMAGNPLISAGKLLTKLHTVGNDETRMRLARNLISKERKLLVARLLLFRLKGWTSIGKSIPVYCYPDERETVEAALSGRFPKGKWEFRHTWSNYGEPLPKRMVVQEVSRHLEREPVALMTRRYSESADYFLSVFEFESYLIFEELLRTPWPGERA